MYATGDHPDRGTAWPHNIASFASKKIRSRLTALIAAPD
jgi:hypothetical protein